MSYTNLWHIKWLISRGYWGCSWTELEIYPHLTTGTISNHTVAYRLAPHDIRVPPFRKLVTQCGMNLLRYSPISPHLYPVCLSGPHLIIIVLSSCIKWMELSYRSAWLDDTDKIFSVIFLCSKLTWTCDIKSGNVSWFYCPFTQIFHLCIPYILMYYCYCFLQFLVNDMDNQYLEIQCTDAGETESINSLGT